MNDVKFGWNVINYWRTRMAEARKRHEQKVEAAGRKRLQDVVDRIHYHTQRFGSV